MVNIANLQDFCKKNLPVLPLGTLPSSLQNILAGIECPQERDIACLSILAADILPHLKEWGSQSAHHLFLIGKNKEAPFPRKIVA